MSLRGIDCGEIFQGQKCRTTTELPAEKETAEGRAHRQRREENRPAPCCSSGAGLPVFSVPSCFLPRPRPRYRSLLDAFEGAALKRANVAYVRGVRTENRSPEWWWLKISEAGVAKTEQRRSRDEIRTL